eukprot:1051934-Rhodomonas_salina.1
MADALTKSLPFPSFSKHQTYLQGSRVPFEAFYARIGTLSPTPGALAWRALQARLACTGAV